MFNKTDYLIKEHVSFLKLHDKYDIIDPESGEIIGYAKETIGTLQKLSRLLINKKLLPTTVGIFVDEEMKLVLKKKGVFVPYVLLMQGGEVIGTFKTKPFSLGGYFKVLNKGGKEIASIKGDWKGWNFKFLDTDSNEIGIITKKWAGIGKEFFTSADNYMVSLNKELDGNSEFLIILLSAAISIDIIFKGRK